jgi:hypothetical protein|tara:strand:- start:315 stop:644 length:330 start_codon:yes stop_codon:yes gene_type:complete
MAKVNWVKDTEYYETQSTVLNAYFVELWNSKKEIYIHDPETSNDQPDELLRVLDDSPKKDWVEFLRYKTSMENHRGFSKEQCDGSTLVVIREAYPGATELPPLYLLIKE